ncbi:MAG: hypothetical protein K2M02_03955, partial [Duncaniella sp.]|nr:hypothetical protein [Duncaniella sp.]
MMMSNLISTSSSKIFLLSTILLTAGCTESDKDLPSAASSAIEFDNVFVDNLTRGIITTENIEAFKLYGFVDNPSSVIFNGVLVTKKGDSWIPSKTEYCYPGQQYR